MRRLSILLIVLLSLPGFAHAEGRVAQIVRATGRVIGYSAGIVTTAALALSKKWNRPLIASDGEPARIRVDGRDFTLRVRHAPLVGPKVLAFAARMKRSTKLQRLRRDFVVGVGRGATKAPPAEGRFEARISAELHP